MPETNWTPTKNAPLTGAYDDMLALVAKAAHVDSSEDVLLRQFTVLGARASLLYIDGLADDTKIQHFILQPCMIAPPLAEGVDMQAHLIASVLPVGSVTVTTQLASLLTRVFSGDAAMLVDGVAGALVLDVKGLEKRSVDKPVNEAVIQGPQEGFNESLRTNISLIRRIMRTPALISEEMRVGNKIPTRLCLLYLDGVAREEVVTEIKRRIEGCNVDYVSSLGMLMQLIEDSPWALLPQIGLTERPDRAASFLLEGQVVIAMENAPNVLCAPMSVLHLYHAPDDTTMRWQYGTFLRFVRVLGVALALVLPAIFVALTMHHPEAMSLSLLISVIESQSRVPLSIFSSTILMLIVFNLINEAGTRVPGIMGSSLGIVSALILGQAAVDADLVSTLMIIVVALSGLGSYALPNYGLSLAVRILQILMVLASGIWGYLGIVLFLFLFLARVLGMRSLGFPYAAPISPLRPANPDRVLRYPIWRQRLRGYIANPNNMDRTTGRMRAWDTQGKENRK